MPVRNSVHYLAAPPGAGKTASLLPAFLASKGAFTYYLYIAFDNKEFPREPVESSSDDDTAVNQDAAFIFECANNNPLNNNPLHKDHTIHAMNEYLEAVVGVESRALIHVDKHKNMCA